MTAAIYLRLSNDDGRAGESQSIESQRADCLAYAARLGLPTVEYADDGFSASKPDVIRPAFIRMQEAIAAGDITTVIASKQDRLSRITQVWAEFATLLTIAGVECHTVEAGNLDLQSDTGLLNTDIRSAFAAFEARLIASRTKRGLETSRSKGSWTSTATFGYEKRGVVNEDQAKWIRWAYEQIIDQGASTRSVFDAFRANGVKTARGNDFYSVGNVIAMLKNPALAGLVTYKGEVIGTGAWEAIVTPAERDRLIATIAARATSAKGHGKRAARKYALSGLVLCGNPECKTYLGVMAAQNPGNGRNHYFYCDPRRDGCKTRIKGKELDSVAHVVALAFVNRDEKPPALEVEAFDPTEMLSVQGEIAEVRKMVTAGDMRASDAAAILRGLNTRVDALKAAKAENEAALAAVDSWHSARYETLASDDAARFRGIIDNVQALPNGAGFIFESRAGQVQRVTPTDTGGWQIF